MIEQIKSPVLFMVFNRPEKTKEVWNKIKIAKPNILYISSDAPRDNHPEDHNKVTEVREIIKDVDWDCNVHHLFHETNQGCSLAGKKAFDWVLESEDRFIELEDDTVPSLSYFTFMDHMLEKYENNNNIAYITGQNFMGITSGNASYFFSHYGGSSGWATWKRTYSQWNYKLTNLYDFLNDKNLKKNFDTTFEYHYWKNLFKNYYLNGGNTYDLQSVFLIFQNDFLNIVPNTNLITNIGFDIQGTNYNKKEEWKFANKARYEMTEIIHPDQIKRSSEIDKQIFKYHFVDKSPYLFYLKWTLGPVYHRVINSLKLTIA